MQPVTVVSEQRERLLQEIVIQISRSISPQIVLDIAVLEARQVLQADRVLVYQCNSDQQKEVVIESIAGAWPVMLGERTDHVELRQNGGDTTLRKGQAVSDIYQANLTTAQVEELERFQVKAYLAMPIWVGDRPWGSLLIHQCTSTRTWQPDELNFVEQLALHLAIALQQADTQQQLHKERKIRQQLEAQMQTSESSYPPLMPLTIASAVSTDAADAKTLMSDRKQAEAALQSLVESTAAVTGKDFFATLAQQLMLALKVKHVLVSKLVGNHLQTLAYWKDGAPQPNITFALADAPCCARAIEYGEFYCSRGLRERFAEYPLIQALESESYLGIPLTTMNGQRIGNLCILDSKPMENIQWAEAFLRIFSVRAAAELERQQATEALEQLNQELEDRVEHRTASLRESKAKLSAMFNQAAVGINLASLDGRYLKVNQKLCDILGYTEAELLTKHFWDISHPEDFHKGEAERRLLYAGEIDSFSIEKRFLHKNGHSIWVNLTVSLIRRESGEADYSIGIIEDISSKVRLEHERKHAEHALKQSEEQFRTVFDYAPIAISLVRVDNYQVFRVNTAHRELFGYSDDELTTMSLIDLTHPDDVAEDLNQVGRMVRGEIPGFQMEKRFIKKNGDIMLTTMTVALIRDADGHPLYSMAMIEDITKRKQSEIQLKTQQEFLRRLLDTVPNLIFVKDWDGRFTIANQATANLYQTTVADLIGKTSADFNPNWAEVEQFLAVDREVMTTMTTTFLEETVTTAHGEQRYFQTIKTPIISVDGHSKEVLGVATDISDRKQIEEQLRQSEAHLLEAQHIAHVGSWQFEIATQKITWSAETFRMFGRDPKQQEPTYEELIQAVHPEDREQHKAVFQWAIAQIEAFELEHRVIRPDGTTTYVLVKGQPIVGEAGRLRSILGTVLDITSRKQFEEQLRHTNEQLATINMELARATRLKDEFLANMSHELRTPLNAILGMAEGLQDEVFGSLNKKQLNALQLIEHSGCHLLELINDILDIAKIESGQLGLEVSPTAIAPLCQSSVAFIKQQALTKNIQLDIQLCPNLPDLLVDERRIRQALLNLLSNAVKFTPEGGQITLEVICPDLQDKAPGESHFLQIAVTDTGIGIAPEYIPQLFQPFIQIDSALNRKYEGTGLGLALVKRIVELHEGQVRLTSEVGVGSCFTIDLPYVVSTVPSSQPSPPIQSSPETHLLNPTPPPLVLLAEDNEANIITISSYLEAKGYRMLLAGNGQEAVFLAQSQNPDLILMDIQMPGMDGLEAMRHIRRNPTLANVPIIALTALAMDGDCERCLAAGANDYLTKPIRLKKLAHLLANLSAHPMDLDEQPRKAE